MRAVSAPVMFTHGRALGLKTWINCVQHTFEWMQTEGFQTTAWAAPHYFVIRVRFRDTGARAILRTIYDIQGDYGLVDGVNLSDDGWPITSFSISVVSKSMGFCKAR